jgi:hypothetical protein
MFNKADCTILKNCCFSSLSGSSKVVCIYKLWRPGEDQQEKFKKLDNHKMLWHGSSMSNFMSILHNGLLVAPPEAPITGHAFGEVWLIVYLVTVSFF